MAWGRSCTSHKIKCFVLKTSFGLSRLGFYWTDRIKNDEVFQKAKEECLFD